jgi:hypothetical protein
MLMSKLVIVKWHPSNIQRYTQLGYEYTKMNDEVEIMIKHLAPSSHSLVSVRCDYCGIEFKKTFDKFTRARKESLIKKDACKKCKIIKTREINKALYGEESPLKVNRIASRVAEKRRLDFAIIIEEFKSRNLELLSEEKDYKTNKSKLSFICKEHEEIGFQKIDWNSFKQKERDCKICGTQRYRAYIRTLKKNFDDVKKAFDLNGDILITTETEYSNNRSVLRYICPYHRDEGIIETDWSHYGQGKRCIYCKGDNFKGANNPRWKGGITNISYALRPSSTYQWRKDSINYYESKCVVTKEAFIDGSGAEVHHNNKNYSDIFIEMLQVLDLDIRESIDLYTCEQIDKMKTVLSELHYKYGYGIPLKKEVHDLFHKDYGKGNTTPEQFEEFKGNYNKKLVD